MKRQLTFRRVAIGTLFTIATSALTLGLSPAAAQEASNAEGKASTAVNPDTVTGSGTADYITIWKSAT
jgi:hypothetical protein